MLGNEAHASQATQLLSPVSAANTAAATSGWVAVPDIVGDVVFTLSLGAVTGSHAGKIRHSADSGGGSPADVTGGGFTSQSDSTHIERISVPRNALKGWVQYVGTIVTGPSLVSVTMIGRPRNV